MAEQLARMVRMDINRTFQSRSLQSQDRYDGCQSPSRRSHVKKKKVQRRSELIPSLSQQECRPGQRFFLF